MSWGPLRKLVLAALVCALGLPLLAQAAEDDSGDGYAHLAGPVDWFRPGTPFSYDFPDPSVTPVGPYSIFYSTNQGGAHLPAAWTTDLSTLTARSQEPDTADPCYDVYENDALENPNFGIDIATPTVDRGCTSKEIWAPTVTYLQDRWVAFVAARVSSSRFCIFRATAPTAFGPFTGSSTRPFVCSRSAGGSIDPEVFVDRNGRVFLLWKSEAWGSIPTRIYGRELNSIGAGWASGSVSRLLVQFDRSWERHRGSSYGSVENPSMVRHGDSYLLFYSGGDWRTADYGVGYAVCAGPLGPCTKRTTTNHLGGLDRPGRYGSGGADAFVDDRGRLLLAYHAWDRSGGLAAGGHRKPYVAELSASGSTVEVRRADQSRGAGPDYLWRGTPDGFSSAAQSVRGTYTPTAGDFGLDGADDLLWYGAWDAGDYLWTHRPGADRVSSSIQRNGSLLPLTGDFDGNGTDDIYWYAPGHDPIHPDADYRSEYWWTSPDGSARIEPVPFDGYAFPLVGDFDGNLVDDILWYAPGSVEDVLWLHLPGGVRDVRVEKIHGFYQYPQVGDFDGNGIDDILWYAPGRTTDYLWLFQPGGVHTSRARTANGVYVPATGDFDGNGIDDILWYGPGGAADFEWRFQPGGAHSSRAVTVRGHYTTIVGDFDGNGFDDIFWYS